MQITLKQSEITAALRQYIGKNINLEGKSFDVAYSMSRSPTLLSATLTIEDKDDVQPVVIPGFTDAPSPAAEAVAPTLAVDNTSSVATVAADQPDPVETAEEAKEEATLGDPVQEAETHAEGTTEVSTTASLFKRGA